MGQKKYKVATLGCRTNQYESQGYIDQLQEMGYIEATGDEKADVCIVNTCTVTENADKKSLYQIRKLSEHHPEAQLVVTGCMAEREKNKISHLPGVTHVVSNGEKEALLKDLFPEEDVPEFSIKNFEAHTRAFVKIQDGCNSYCSYCIIPFVRGRSRSKKKEAILKEIHALVENGYKEVVLTGINIGDFDGDVEPKMRLSDLIREVDQIEGLERIRVSSIDPDEVDEDLISAILEGEKTCHSMHIVLQAGSNSVLKRMNRKYTRGDFISALGALRKAAPDFTVTTDIIVGFPGESEEDFQETLEMIEKVQFAKVHLFPYSKRPKTRAARFTDHLPQEVITKRKQHLLRATEEASYQLRNGYIGKRLKVLLEDEDTNHPGYIRGHSENFLTVYVSKKNERSNDIITVECLENRPEGLFGQKISD